jgi:hypothetical protein
VNKTRINVLARELGVKAHEIVDALPELGVTEKKTHSSSIDDDVAEKLRQRFAVPAAKELAPRTRQDFSQEGDHQHQDASLRPALLIQAKELATKTGPTSLLKHYIKIRTNLRQYAFDSGAPEADWRSVIFRDITNGGILLTYESLPDNAEGSRIGLCGRQFYCEAALDKDREDSLFVFRVWPSRPMRSPTKTYEAQFELLTSKTFGTYLDPIKKLRGLSREQRIEEPFTSADIIQNVPSEQLAQILSNAPEDLLLAWSPDRTGSELASVHDFVQAFRKPWVRFRLEKYARLSPRQESIVNETVRPNELDTRERDALLGLFNFDTFNSLTRDQADNHEAVYDLLNEVSLLPVPATLRARMWATMHADLGRSDFLRRLKLAATPLCSIGQRSESDARTWQEVLLPIIKALADREIDPSLSKLYEDSLTQTSPLEYIAGWVERLDFRSAPLEAAGFETPISPRTDLDSLPTLIPEPVAPVPGHWPELQTTAIDRWVLGRQVANVELLDAAIRQIEEHLSRVGTLVPVGRGIHRIAELGIALRGLGENIHEWLKQLPDPNTMATDYREALEVYQQAEKLMGTEVDAILSSGGGLTPRDLREAIEMVNFPEHMGALPAWAWSLQDQPPPQPVDYANRVRAWVERLIIPEIRERVKSILEAFRELEDDDVTLLSMVSPPAGDDSEIRPLDVYEHVRKWFRDFRDLVAPLPAQVRAHFQGVPASAADNDRLIYCAGIFRDVRGRLAAATAVQLVEQLTGIRNQEELQRLGDSYLLAVERLESLMGEASSEVNFRQLKAMAERAELDRPREKRATAEVSGPPLWVEHNWVGTKAATRATLVYFRDESQPYGSVSVPLQLRTKHRKSWRVKLNVKVRSGHRDNWPTIWPLPTPQEIEVTTWRTDSDHPETSNYSFKLILPIQLHRGRGEKFRFDLEVLDQETSLTLGTYSFEWDVINEAPESIAPVWPQSTEPRYVDKNPIGPQRKSSDILRHLGSFGSFAVMAPRRFGKSTLVEYLAQRNEEQNFVVPEAIVCTDPNYFKTNRVFDYDRFWNDLSHRLQKKTGSSISPPFHNRLPDENAFDHIRRAVWSKGKKGITILVDEAQLFFPRTDGTALGDLLKDRLERHWSRQDMHGLVPLTIGLVGLPGLRLRAGANLLGLLRTFDHDRLDQEELYGLILSITGGNLQTTREARELLAKSAGNLFTLRTLLDELATDIFSDQRTWANFDDVSEVEKELKHKLREGQPEDLAAFVRDGLNDAESVNQWEPNASLALAVALASSREKGSSSTGLHDEATRQLRSWCEEFKAGTPIVSLTYDSDQFRDHLQILQERRVFQNTEFSSELLESWLLGQRRERQTNPDGWCKMLLKAAVRRIRSPEPLERVEDAEGGQARVWRYVSEGIKYAVRTTSLLTQENRARFIEEKGVLDILQKRVSMGERGHEYIFRLEQVGLSADNEHQAIQIYRWVDGVDLARKREELDDPFVADLGIKLARALQFLHAAGILHRDLRPQNIILSEPALDPVIIDFGFARRLADGAKTRIDDQWAADEVRGENPIWSPAADIYSLGKTLRAVLASAGDHTALCAVLDRCCCPEPDKRPSGAELETLFKRAAIDLHVDAKKEKIWMLVSALSKTDQARLPWLSEVLTKFRPKFEALTLGCGNTQFDRCRQVATLLNEVLEANGRRELSRGRVKAGGLKEDSQLATPEINLLHRLRTFESHFVRVTATTALAEIGSPDDASIRRMTLSGTEQIATVVNVPCLPAIVQAVLL